MASFDFSKTKFCGFTDLDHVIHPRLLIFSYLCGYVWTQVFHINWWLYFVILEGSGTGQIGVKDFLISEKHLSMGGDLWK